MNIKMLHAYLGRLIESGVSPELPVAGIVSGVPHEIFDVRLLSGIYFNDPSPKLVAHSYKNGQVLALIPINEDVSDLLNDGTHTETELPIELQ